MISVVREALQHSVGYTNSLSFAIDGTGTNTYLTVEIAIRAASNITGVTYNGVAMTKLAERDQLNNTSAVQIWGLKAPASGSHDVVVSLGSYQLVSAHATLFSGVEQSTGSIEASATAEGYSALAEVPITTLTTDAYVLAAYNVKSTVTATVGAGQTEIENTDNSDANLGQLMVAGKEVDAAAYTMSYTWAAADNWVGAAIALVAYVAPGSPSVGRRIIIC